MNKFGLIFSLIFMLYGLVACERAVNSSFSVGSNVGDNAPSRTLILAQPATRQWWHDAVIYQIWPRSFSDADGDGNGDFVGMTKKLPYLQSLGVKAVWLTPVFESPSYHGYDTADFYSVESDYGTQAEFDGFLQQAESAGIKVILDLVINHVSNQHPWFLKSVNKEPGYEDFFVWSKTLPANYGSAWSDVPDPKRVWYYNKTRKEFYYSVFGAAQPDLNFKNPVVVAEIKKIVAFWLAKGVDGFRLDAVRYFVEEGGIPYQADTQGTLDFLVDLNKFVKSQNPNAYLIGEALASNELIAKYYDHGKGIDAVFDFDFAAIVGGRLELRAVTTALTDEENNQNVKLLREALWRNLSERSTPIAPNYFFSPVVNNHDLNRMAIRVKEQPASIKLAASLLLLSPATPYMYYGEEIGMSQAGVDDDMYRRGLMQWDDSANAGFNTTDKRWMDDAAWFPWKETFTPWWGFYWKNITNKLDATVAGQASKPNSMLSFYKKLIALRNSDATLRNPDSLKLYENTGNAWVVKYSRGHDSRWIILNLDPNKSTSFTVPPVLQGVFVNLLNDGLLNVGAEMTIEAGELYILSDQ